MVTKTFIAGTVEILRNSQLRGTLSGDFAPRFFGVEFRQGSENDCELEDFFDGFE